MGKNQKIPYLNEVAIYCIKVMGLFLILNYFLAKMHFYSHALLLIFCIFAGFSFNLTYLSLVSLNYAVLFLVAGNKGDLWLLLTSFFSILLNTFIIILYLKVKFKLKEEK